MGALFHFSEDPDIRLSFWFPRECPRACCWAGDKPLSEAGAVLLGGGQARRLHAIEAQGLERVRACRRYAYEFDPEPFESKTAEAGFWVARCDIVPRTVRTVNNPWPLIDAMIASGLAYSMIRSRNAQPRQPAL